MVAKRWAGATWFVLRRCPCSARSRPAPAARFSLGELGSGVRAYGGALFADAVGRAVVRVALVGHKLFPGAGRGPGGRQANFQKANKRSRAPGPRPAPGIEQGDERPLPLRVPADLPAARLRHGFELDDQIALRIEQHRQRSAILLNPEGWRNSRRGWSSIDEPNDGKWGL